jgi:hypothetical protein
VDECKVLPSATVCSHDTSTQGLTLAAPQLKIVYLSSGSVVGPETN